MELLPRGGFRINTADFGTIEGRFSLLTKKAFCDKCFHGSLADMLTAAAKSLTTEQVATLLLCGINRSDLTIENAYDIIDEAGGLLALQTIVNHAFQVEVEAAKKKYGADAGK